LNFYQPDGIKALQFQFSFEDPELLSKLQFIDLLCAKFDGDWEQPGIRDRILKNRSN
jgi:hypothetical protein